MLKKRFTAFDLIVAIGATTLVTTLKVVRPRRAEKAPSAAWTQRESDAEPGSGQLQTPSSRGATDKIRARRDRGNRAEWVQAVSAIVGILVASVAGIMALQTLRNQEEINRSQLQLNQVSRDRTDQRYALRVAYWWDLPNTWAHGQFVRLVVQNRSPTPISVESFVLDAAYETAKYTDSPAEHPRPLMLLLGQTLPPCVIVTYSIPADTELGGTVGGFGRSYPELWQMRFSDVVGSWITGPTGLRRDPRPHASWLDLGADPAERLNETPKSRRAADNCGEGG